MNRALSVFLVGLGLLALAWGALSFNTNLQLADAPLSPVVAGVALLGGAILAINPKRL
jgi:hypothetical protein